METRIILSIFAGMLSVGFVCSVITAFASCKHWLYVRRSNINGARLGLAWGALRRSVLWVVFQGSLISVLAPRIFWDHPPSPAHIGLSYTFIAISALWTSVGDLFELYTIESYIKSGESRRKEDPHG